MKTASGYTLQLIGEDLKPLAEHEYCGQTYVGVTPSAKFSIRISGPTKAETIMRPEPRFLAVLSVDGRNPVDNTPAKRTGRGWVVSDSRTICGWQVSATEVANFYFAEPHRSYVARSGGESASVGIISAAFFYEEEFDYGA